MSIAIRNAAKGLLMLPTRWELPGASEAELAHHGALALRQLLFDHFAIVGDERPSSVFGAGGSAWTVLDYITLRADGVAVIGG